MNISPADQVARGRAAMLSLGVGVVMLVLKMGAWMMTGSATVLSDALESVVHVAATSFMFFFFRWSQQPADPEHPYGHGRAAPISVGFEGGMVLLAGVAVAWEAVSGLWAGHPPGRLDYGLLLIGLAAAINLVLGLHLVRVGRRTKSQVLVADGQHVLSDVWTSAGTLAGVGLMFFIHDPRWLVIVDGGIALILAGVIVVTAVSLIRESIGSLMDEADRGLLQQIIDSITEIRDPAWVDVHELRCRRSGDQLFVDFHLTVPAEWTILQGHAAVDQLETHVLKRLGTGGAVLVHLDYPHHPDGTPIPLAELRCVPLTVEQAIRTKV